MALRTHRVRYGETLSSIAETYYGDPALYTFIYQHNRHYIENVNQLYPGQIIVIPYLPMKELVRRGLTVG